MKAYPYQDNEFDPTPARYARLPSPNSRRGANGSCMFPPLNSGEGWGGGDLT